VARWSNPVPTANVDALRIYLHQPLTEEEKIPIPQHSFDILCFPYIDEYGALTDQELLTLFRVSTNEHAYRGSLLFMNAISSTPPLTGTEDLFHSTYDNNISSIVKFILGRVTPIRNSNRGTSTALQRPDYGLLVNENCILRGEEKGSDSAGDPKRELVDKIVQWKWHPLRYILGYYAETTKVSFVAITCPPSRAMDLFSHDLSIRNQRVANLVHLIRLTSVMAWMGKQLPAPERPEFVQFDRENGNVQMTIGTVVRKQFLSQDAVQRVSHLINIYQVLVDKNVPNVDCLDSANINTDPPEIFLSPVGTSGGPTTGEETFTAVVCVLRALKVMHADPPVYHRDIRTHNIIRKFDGQGWFLIDFSDASTAPTRGVTHLKESEHSPRVRQNDHGPEVDIWGVARYMEEWASYAMCRMMNSEDVKKMARRWMEDISMTATIALDEIERVECFFATPVTATPVTATPVTPEVYPRARARGARRGARRGQRAGGRASRAG